MKKPPQQSTRNPLLILMSTIMMCAAMAPAIRGNDNPSRDEEGVGKVVRAMNQAVTDRDLKMVLSYFSAGSVQLNLRPAHQSEGSETELVSDLADRWRAIAPILFANTKSYSRVVEAMTLDVDGDLASVWARIRTETEPLAGGEVSTMSYSESYVVFRLDGEWKIVAMANSRATR